ncbi:MAG: hypothetical protein OEL76_03955 [Siculibacillus sp.]|nr:hypothetical protein [Siculibacillus sp.]
MLDEDTKFGLWFLGKFIGAVVLGVFAIAAVAWVVHGLDALGLVGTGSTHRFGG